MNWGGGLCSSLLVVFGFEEDGSGSCEGSGKVPDPEDGALDRAL